MPGEYGLFAVEAGQVLLSADLELGRIIMRRWAIVVCICAMITGPAAAIAADDINDCDSPETEKRIPACTELIETPGISPTRRATAFANRALAFSLRGQFETAIRDYDAAIQMFPDFAVALNNRAWAYFKWGKLGPATRLDPLV